MVLTARAGFTEQPGNKLLSIPIAAGETIFDGALVAIANGGANDGRLINWDDSVTGVANFFLGLARVTEAVGVIATEGEAKIGDTAGTEESAVDVTGVVIKGVIMILMLTATQLGNLVYADDENTFTTQVTVGTNPVGYIVRFIQAGFGDVKLFGADAYRAHRGI